MSCDNFNGCDACTTSWSCVWCGAQGCVSGNPFGGSGCSDAWSWRQCTFAGWVLLLIVALGVVLVITVLLLCCCCACRCRRQRREKRDYKDLERKQKEAKSAPHQERLRAAISPPGPIVAPPKKKSWFQLLFSRGGEERGGPSESTPLSDDRRMSGTITTERVKTAEETNPFSISDV
jgi:hypothetical protein